MLACIQATRRFFDEWWDADDATLVEPLSNQNAIAKVAVILDREGLSDDLIAAIDRAAKLAWNWPLVP